MGDAAVLAARAIDYANAGTVEFIVAPSGDFYFMEINTRLQVEHPVTEMTTGLDLVDWQLRIAAGEALPLAQADVPRIGHAIEVRLYAEDPDAGFLPGSGTLRTLRLPTPSAHVRVDSGVVEGDTVTIFYDPMIAKLIVHDTDRPRALARLREALADCAIEGPKSNIAFLERLVRHPAIVDATIDTGYLDRHLEQFIAGDDDAAPDPALLAAAAVAGLSGQARASGGDASPWAIDDGWRLGARAARRAVFEHRGQRHLLAVTGDAGDYDVASDSGRIEVRGARLHAGTLSARFDGRARQLQVHTTADAVLVHDGVARLELRRIDEAQRSAAGAADADDRVRAPMPGRVVAVRVQAGDAVTAGQELLVMEAMKMELALKAPRDGTVAELRAQVGEFVEADATLAVLA